MDSLTLKVKGERGKKKYVCMRKTMSEMETSDFNGKTIELWIEQQGCEQTLLKKKKKQLYWSLVHAWFSHLFNDSTENLE